MKISDLLTYIEKNDLPLDTDVSLIEKMIGSNKIIYDTDDYGKITENEVNKVRKLLRHPLINIRKLAKIHGLSHESLRAFAAGKYNINHDSFISIYDRYIDLQAEVDNMATYGQMIEFLMKIFIKPGSLFKDYTSHILSNKSYETITDYFQQGSNLWFNHPH